MPSPCVNRSYRKQWRMYSIIVHFVLRTYTSTSRVSINIFLLRLKMARYLTVSPRIVFTPLTCVCADQLTHIDFAVGGDDIRAAKLAGDANNDWVLTQRLCALKGVQVSLEAVTAHFQLLYKGDPARGLIGLEQSERLIPDAALLRDLAAAGIAFAVVTGRPAAEARGFLATHSLTQV
jgi:hypothetical protein